MDFKFLKLRKQGSTRILLLNSPPVNGLNLEVVEELSQALSQLRQEGPQVRCLILTSHIDGVFIAGADIKMIKGYMEGPDLVGDMIHFNTRLQETINEFETLPFPVIAAMNGHALGGGLEVALACDFRFLANGKARVGLPEVTLGLLPGAGGTQRLSRLIGKAGAKEIIFQARKLDAKTALALGIVDRICEAGSLMEEALQYADSMQGGSPVSISVVKSCINEGIEHPLNKGLAIEMEGLEQLLNTADAREGVTAFLEKRKPAFSGQ